MLLGSMAQNAFAQKIEALSNTIGPRSVWRFTPLRVMYPVLDSASKIGRAHV